MEKFEKEITFLTKVAVAGDDGQGLSWKNENVTKNATFKELSQTDKDQHKLHFKIISLMEMFNVKEGEESGKMNISSDALYDLTVKSINTLLLIDEKFTSQDKTEFLSDSAAILRFGLWMLSEKLMPFFSNFKVS